MQAWAALQFAGALAVAVSIFALIISQLHIIEKAEEQEWQELQEKVASIR